MKKNNLIILLLSLLHLLCDLICGYKVVGILANDFYHYSIYIFIIYNGIAFCLQPVMGLLIDKYNIYKISQVLSVVFLTLGLIIPSWLFSSIFLGLGNQIFHIIGGKICTNINSEKSAHLGVFVSLGAIGLAIGSNYFIYKWISLVSALLYFALSIVVILIYNYKPISKTKEVQIKNNNKLLIPIFLLVITVFIRSFLGKIIHFDFSLNTTLIMLIAVFSSLGKMLGGFIRDILGSLKTITICMIIAIFLLIFGSKIEALMLTSMLLINISMPITLYELNKVLPNKEGLSFGILAGVLFPGVAIGLLYQFEPISYIIIIIISSLLSIYSIYFVTRKWKRDTL